MFNFNQTLAYRNVQTKYLDMQSHQMILECCEIILNHPEFLPEVKSKGNFAMDGLMSSFLSTVIYTENQYRHIFIMAIQHLFGLRWYDDSSADNNHHYHESSMYCADVVSPGMKSLLEEIQEEGN